MTSEIDIQLLIDAEHKAMCEKHNQELFNSHHEKYAVLLEEFEEAQDEMESALQARQLVWAGTKLDNEYMYTEHAKRMKEYVIQAIQELIQVAAVCDKGIKEREETDVQR